jgi:hypothetical protein
MFKKKNKFMPLQLNILSSPYLIYSPISHSYMSFLLSRQLKRSILFMLRFLFSSHYKLTFTIKPFVSVKGRQFQYGPRFYVHWIIDIIGLCDFSPQARIGIFARRHAGQGFSLAKHQPLGMVRRISRLFLNLAGRGGIFFK